jgi:hypothetical protein
MLYVPEHPTFPPKGGLYTAGPQVIVLLTPPGVVVTHGPFVHIATPETPQTAAMQTEARIQLLLATSFPDNCSKIEICSISAALFLPQTGRECSEVELFCQRNGFF